MVFVNAYIYTAEGKAVANGYLSVSGGRIAGVGSMEEFEPRDGDAVIDLKGKRIYPGRAYASRNVGGRHGI